MTVYKDYQTINNSLIKVPYFEITCKYCGSKNVIKYGFYNGIQRFFCDDCKRKFTDCDSLINMQTPIDQVGSAISMYYEGQSLNSVRRLLTQIYNSYPSDSTVYRWITRFSKQAVNETKDDIPIVGNTWVADETVLDIDGKNVWFWDIIDSDTRYLLASHISKTRTTKDAQKLMELASKRANKTPKVILTDKLRAYLDGIELTFGGDTKHIQSKPFTIENNTNLIERFHGTLKDRTKVMRGLKDIRTARALTDGWLFYYNYLRPHESLNNKTPAGESGIKYPYKNWQEVIAKREIITPAKVSATSTLIIRNIPQGLKATKKSKSRFNKNRRRSNRPKTPVTAKAKKASSYPLLTYIKY